MDESLVLLVHGPSGAGKSPLGCTSPAPRLVLDAENGTRFVRGIRKKEWDPIREAPPEPGDWDTCVVKVRDFETMKAAFRWLNSGQHPFVSLVFDSLTEIQKRCKDAIRGEGEDMTERRWGQLLDQMERLVRDFRDLTMHPTRPLKCVVFLALTDEKKGRIRPLVQGGLAMTLPGFLDVLAYMQATTDETGAIRRYLTVQPDGTFPEKDVKDRTGALGVHVWDPNVEQMRQTINQFLEMEGVVIA